MELPLYFNLKDFKKNYLVDFKHLIDKNPSLKIIDYYKCISSTYFTIHADLNRIDYENNDFIVYIFDKFHKKDGFLDFLYDQYFDTIIKKLKERNTSNHNYILSPEIVKEIITENFEMIGSMIEFVAQEIQEFILNEIYKIEFHTINKKAPKSKTYSNPQKLALLHELGFFDLPVFATLTETKINEITGLLLNANPKEFIYKNRLNLKSKLPNYQTDKYTAYQYLEEMEKLISDTD